MPATLRQTARAAGVSVSTASRVLAGRAGEARISAAAAGRVRAAARRLGYRPNLLARSLRTSRSRTLGLVVTDMANIFFANIAAAVEAEASAAGYTVMVAASGENADREVQYLLELQSRRVDGLLVTPAAGSRVQQVLGAVARAGATPLAVIDRLLPGLACDRVVTDSRRAAAALVAELVRFGCRRPALAGGPAGVWTAAERLAGFRDGLAAAGLPFPRGLVRSGPYSVEHGRSTAAAFLAGRQPPDGIVAANNKILVGVLEALAAAGGRARSVAVAGFDGVPFAAFLGRAVAIAEQPEEDIGRTAARMLIERIEGRRGPPREIRLPVRIRSFAPPPGR